MPVIAACGWFAPKNHSLLWYDRSNKPVNEWPGQGGGRGECSSTGAPLHYARSKLSGNEWQRWALRCPRRGGRTGLCYEGLGFRVQGLGFEWLCCDGPYDANEREGEQAWDAEDSYRVLHIGPASHCPPRHPKHSEPSFLELHVAWHPQTWRALHYLTGPTLTTKYSLFWPRLRPYQSVGNTTHGIPAHTSVTPCLCLAFYEFSYVRVPVLKFLSCRFIRRTMLYRLLRPRLRPYQSAALGTMVRHAPMTLGVRTVAGRGAAAGAAAGGSGGGASSGGIGAWRRACWMEFTIVSRRFRCHVAIVSGFSSIDQPHPPANDAHACAGAPRRKRVPVRPRLPRHLASWFRGARSEEVRACLAMCRACVDTRVRCDCVSRPGEEHPGFRVSCLGFEVWHSDLRQQTDWRR